MKITDSHAPLCVVFHVWVPVRLSAGQTAFPGASSLVQVSAERFEVINTLLKEPLCWFQWVLIFIKAYDWNLRHIVSLLLCLLHSDFLNVYSSRLIFGYNHGIVLFKFCSSVKHFGLLNEPIVCTVVRQVAFRRDRAVTFLTGYHRPIEP